MSTEGLHAMRQIVAQMQSRLAQSSESRSDSRLHEEVPSSDASRMGTVEGTRTPGQSSNQTHMGISTISRDSHPASRERSVTLSPSPIVDGASAHRNVGGFMTPHIYVTAQSPQAPFPAKKKHVIASPLADTNASSRAYYSLLHEKDVSKAILVEAQVVMKSARQLAADAIALIKEARNELKISSLEGETEWLQRQRKIQGKVLEIEKLSKRRRAHEEAQHRKTLDELFKETCSAAIKLKQLTDEEYEKTTQRRRAIEKESKVMLAQARAEMQKIQEEADLVLSKARSRLAALRAETEREQAKLAEIRREIKQHTAADVASTSPPTAPQHTAAQLAPQHATSQHGYQAYHEGEQAAKATSDKQRAEAGEELVEVLSEARQVLAEMEGAASDLLLSQPRGERAEATLPASCTTLPVSCHVIISHAARMRRLQDGLLAWHLATIRKRSLSYSLSRVMSFPTLASTFEAVEESFRPPPATLTEEALASLAAREGTVI